MLNKKNVKLTKRLLSIGIILISIIPLIFLVSALTSELEIELNDLVSNLEGSGYGWLVDYEINYPSVEVYEDNKTEKIADFGIIDENSPKDDPAGPKKYQVYLDGSSGAGLGNKTQNIFDLKILNGSVEFDYIVDPIILGNANSVNTNTTYENNFTHLNVSNSSIVFYMPFDDNASATTTYDYTNNSNDGTKEGKVIYNTSQAIYGGAMTFNGSGGDAINFSAKIIPLGAKTISVWFKTTDNTGGVVDNSATAGANHGTSLFLGSNGRIVFVSSKGVAPTRFSTWSVGTVNDGTWKHFVATWDGTTDTNTSKIYIDGVLNNQSTALSTETIQATNNLRIGSLGNPYSVDYGFNGSMDEVMIWNTALNSTEVLALYNNQTARFYGTGEMNFTGVNFAGNDTVNITLAGCQQNMGSYLRAKVNNGAYVNFGSGCTIQDYNASGNLNSANVTVGFVSDANRFYTPLVIGNITLDSRDVIVPNITINLPSNNSFSSVTNLSINFTAQSNDLSACWYSNDSYTANTTLTNCNTNITTVQWAEGQHNVTIWVNDTANNVNSSMVTFTIDTTLPTFTWVNPTPADKSGTTSNSTYLNVTVTDATQTSAWFDWNKSLVGYWPMDFRNSTGVYDNSSNENFGTATGGAVFNSSGFYGGAYSFDGVNDYINVSDSTSLTTPNLTVGAWIKSNNIGTEQIVVSKFASGNLGFYLDIYQSKVLLSIDGNSFFQGNTVLTSNTWYHVLATYNGTTRVIYLNGVSDGTSVSSNGISDTASALNIGRYSLTGGVMFNGSIDEVLIFNRVLSSTEILALYNNTANRLQNNFTSLSQQTYNYSAYSIDKAGNLNITSPDRQITVDTTFPTISYDPQTPADNSTTASNSIYVNVSVADSNFENMSYSLYNESLNISGLVGYWPFERNTTTIRDLSKQGNDGTRSGGVNWTTGGKLGNAMSFDGVNDYIARETAVITGTPATFSAWIKPSSNTTWQRILTVNKKGTASNVLGIFLDVNGKAEIQHYDTDSVVAVSTTGINTGEWYHIVGVFNSNSNRTIYVNGILEATNTAVQSAMSGLNYTSIGNIAWSTGQIEHFNGTIDEPMIFNRALSSSEITELYNRQLVNYTTYSSITPSINWTSLADNDYHYFADVLDDAENYNFTQIRLLKMDATFPVPVFANPTTNTSNLSQDFIQANLTFTETNINITNISLYNSTQNIINSTTGTTSPVYINFSDLADGTYYLNATISDTAGNTNQTETRRILLDTINPSLNITFPNNNSFSSQTNLSINYTRSDALAGLSTCWYSNDTYTANTTLANCGNITTVQWTEGKHNLTVWVNDTANNLDFFRIGFTIDTTLPVPVFANPTTNASNLSQNFIQVNVSVTETNLDTINISLFNSTQNIINSTFGTASPVYINFSGLADGTYYLNATMNDSANNINYTGTRKIVLDMVAPNLTINSPSATTYTTSTILFNATSIDLTTLVDSCWYTTNSGTTNRTLSRAGTSNSYNFTQTSIADATYTARFYCNDSANNVNNTENVAFTIDTSVPIGGGPAPAAAGGAGAPSKPSPKRVFNLNYKMYDQTISLNQVRFDKLQITNNGEITDDYAIEVEAIDNIISFEEKKIKLEPGETKGAEFKISSPKEPGIYTGKIIVSNGVSEREVLVTINVKTEKSLFDITLTIPESLKILSAGRNLISKIDLIQMGLKENIDVTLNYVIKDFEGQTYLLESETIAVFDQKSYEKEFFTGELPPGQYVLGTELIHPDGVAVSSTHFVVQAKGVKYGKEEILLSSLILALIIISLVIFLSIRKYKKVGRAISRTKNMR